MTAHRRGPEDTDDAVLLLAVMRRRSSSASSVAAISSEPRRDAKCDGTGEPRRDAVGVGAAELRRDPAAVGTSEPRRDAPGVGAAEPWRDPPGVGTTDGTTDAPLGVGTDEPLRDSIVGMNGPSWPLSASSMSSEPRRDTTADPRCEPCGVGVGDTRFDVDDLSMTYALTSLSVGPSAIFFQRSRSMPTTNAEDPCRREGT